MDDTLESLRAQVTYITAEFDKKVKEALDAQGMIGYINRLNDEHIKEIHKLRELVSDTSYEKQSVCNKGPTNGPYIETVVTIVNTVKEYNPEYGDYRNCVCGHAYYRHFDGYEGNEPVGCKYCDCNTFIEAKQFTSKKLI